MTHRNVGLALLLIILSITPRAAVHSQSAASADIAAYQLGVVAEAFPDSDLTYVITLTNHGPAAVTQFYILDGWTVSASGISGFTMPTPDPDFGAFSLVGTWEQQRSDQTVLAWLLNGNLNPGDTVRFAWKVHVDKMYRGGLVNWARVAVEGSLNGTWQPRADTTLATPPAVDSMSDPIPENNRTTDGVTVVTEAPTNAGIDLALYQTGLLTQLPAGKPLDSTWFVTNRGPQVVKDFYVLAGWSLNPDGGSILSQPVTEPDFSDFKVIGRWQQRREDEELWLWQLQGDLAPGANAAFQWVRALVPNYRGDLINWARVFAHDVPAGDWLPREGTANPPQPLTNDADAVPDNDRSLDGLTTITD